MMLVLLSNELVVVLRMVMVDSIATASGKEGGVSSGLRSWQRQNKKHLIFN